MKQYKPLFKKCYVVKVDRFYLNCKFLKRFNYYRFFLILTCKDIDFSFSYLKMTTECFIV